MMYDEPELVPASNTWRQPLELRGRKANIDGLVVNSLSLDNHLENVSCAALHNEGNYVLVADTSRSRNVCKVIGSVPTKSGYKLSVTNQFTQPDTFTDVGWVNNCMLGASLDGQVYRYVLKPDKTSSPKDVSEVYSHSKLKGMAPSVAPPGRMGYSTRIQRVAISPQESNLFATLENSNIHIWDCEVASAPAMSKKISDWPVTALTWSTHHERRLMVGGLGRALRLFDADTASVVWKKEEAHVEGIVDVKWHPYVPWWVATAGLDGLVNIWDLRCSVRPMATLEDHFNAVTSIAWSPTHSEIIASGGSDRRFKLWNLNLSPHRLLFSEDTEWPVAFVGFWKSEPFKCFAVTQGGEFISATMETSFVAPLVPSGFPGQNGQEREVEKDIYCREFDTAFDKALDTAYKFSKQHRPDLALAVLELCYQRSVPDIDGDIQPDLPLEAALKFFAADLHKYSYYVPPRYHEMFGTKVSEAVMARIQTLRLRLEVQRAVKDENWQDIAERWKDMNEMLQKDNNVFPLSLLVGAVQMVMPHDYIKAIEMGVELADTFGLFGNFPNFAPVARKFYRELWKEQDIITFFEENKPDLVISASVNRIYLSTLLSRQQYDKFFIAALPLLQSISVTPFHGVVQDMIGFAQPRLQRYLKECTVREKSATPAAQQAKFENGLFMALNLLYKCDPLTEELIDAIGPAIKPLTTEIEHALLLLLKNPDPKLGTSGRVQVAAKAKELLSIVEEITGAKKADKMDILIEKDMKKLNNMLSGFI